MFGSIRVTLKIVGAIDEDFRAQLACFESHIALNMKLLKATNSMSSVICYCVR